MVIPVSKEQPMKNDIASPEDNMSITPAKKPELYDPGEDVIVVEPIEWDKYGSIKIPNAAKGGPPIGQVVAVGKGEIIEEALGHVLADTTNPVTTNPHAQKDIQDLCRQPAPCKVGDFIVFGPQLICSLMDDHDRMRIFMPFANHVATVTRPEGISLKLGSKKIVTPFPE